MGNTMGAVSYLQILAFQSTDKMLAKITFDIDKDLIVNLHIQSVDQMKAIKLVKSKVTDINRMKIEEQKKAVRAGYDMDIIPSDLNTYGGEAKRLLEDLQSRNERMFLVTALFLNTAKSKQELENAIFQTAGIAQKYNCMLKRLDYQQEEGLDEQSSAWCKSYSNQESVDNDQYSDFRTIYHTGIIHGRRFFVLWIECYQQ